MNSPLASVSRKLTRVPWHADEFEDKANESKDGDERMLSAWRPIDVERVTGSEDPMGRCWNLYARSLRAFDVPMHRRHGRFAEYDGGDALDVFGVRGDVPEVRDGAGGQRLDRSPVVRPDRGRCFDRLRKLVAHGGGGDGERLARSQEDESRTHESSKRQPGG